MQGTDDLAAINSIVCLGDDACPNNQKNDNGVVMKTEQKRMRLSAIGTLFAFVALNLVMLLPASAEEKLAIAIFAGGCFWCMEGPFDELPGVVSTISGYTGGNVVSPTYKEVSSGKTGHSEAVQVTYDPAKVTYQQLLEVFWRNIDPFDDQGQFCDKGEQYRSAIFYADENQKKLAENSKAEVSKKFPEQTIVTTIRPASAFYQAEDYHQNYYQNNPTTYKFYRYTCGRDKRLDEVWR